MRGRPPQARGDRPLGLKAYAMLSTDPTQLSPTSIKVQLAACWMLGAFSMVKLRGFPRRLGTSHAARHEFHQHVNTALELVKCGSTARGPLVLYDLVAYVERTAPKFHDPLWSPEEAKP